MENEVEATRLDLRLVMQRLRSCKASRQIAERKESAFVTQIFLRKARRRRNKVRRAVILLSRYHLAALLVLGLHLLYKDLLRQSRGPERHTVVICERLASVGVSVTSFLSC